MSNELDRSLLKTLRGKAQGTVAIFDRGDYYVAYEEDATLIATRIFMSDVGVKRFTLGDTQLSYLNINSGQYVRVLRDLLTVLRYRVELYAPEGGVWTCKTKGSIGNLGAFEEVASLESCTVMALKLSTNALTGDNEVSVAFGDPNNMRIVVAEFIDTDLFNQLENCVVGMNPKECLLFPVANKDQKQIANRLKKLRQLMTSFNMVETEYSRESNFEEAVDMFKDNEKASQLSDSLQHCVSAIWSFQNFTEFSGKFQLCDFGASGVMHINGATLQALELFSSNYTCGKGSDINSGTLYSVMNKCKTQHGHRLLREWMVRPLSDLRKIEERQDVVSALYDDHGLRGDLSDQLHSIPDLQQLSKKLCSRRKAKLQDLYRIYQAIRNVKKLATTVSELHEGTEENYKASVKGLMMDPLSTCLHRLNDFMSLIDNTVDVDYAGEMGGYRVKPDMDPNLEEVYNQMNEIKKKCERAYNKAKDRYGVDMKLDCNAMLGWFYKVTLKEEKNLRNNPDIIICDAGKGAGMRFRDNTLDSLNCDYLEYQKSYDCAQKQLEEEIVKAAEKWCDDIRCLSDATATVDVLCALAILASDAPRDYVRPELMEMGTGTFELEKCRHPVLEVKLESSYIPNDVILGSERLIILTGANMGGKSTYLRSAAICALMAQMGSRVPASRAKMSIVDGIYTRVGASDQQSKGISTFMAEMLDSSAILAGATSNSFVIVDELGRGTSTVDGFGLAWAIASDLLERIQCFCLFATHFNEMADLGKHENAKAMQMVVHAENGLISLLYEVRPGVAQSSFGIHVARMVHLPESVVEDAANVLKSLESSKIIEDELIVRLKNAKGEDLRRMLLE